MILSHLLVKPPRRCGTTYILKGEFHKTLVFVASCHVFVLCGSFLVSTLFKTMAIKSKVVTYVLLFAFFSVSFTHARTLTSSEKFKDLPQRVGASFHGRGLVGYESGLCEYCQPIEVCRDLVAWCAWASDPRQNSSRSSATTG